MSETDNLFAIHLYMVHIQPGRSGSWKVTVVKHHNCPTTVGSSTPKPGAPPGKPGSFFPPHAYSAAALAPVVAEVLFNSPKASTDTVLSELQKFVRTKPKAPFVLKVKTLAREALGTGKGGTEQDDQHGIGKIEAFGRLLQEKGHKFRMETIDADAMKEVLPTKFISACCDQLKWAFCIAVLLGVIVSVGA